MSKLFQIREDDLATLEADLPAILGRHYGCLVPADKPAFRRIQEIIKNVRWNYGPPSEVEVIPMDDDLGAEQ